MKMPLFSKGKKGINLHQGPLGQGLNHLVHRHVRLVDKHYVNFLVSAEFLNMQLIPTDKKGVEI